MSREERSPIRYLNMWPLGDQAIVVKLGERPDSETFHKIKALTDYLAEHAFAGMVEVVPGFTSVTVYYDPVSIDSAWRLKGSGVDHELDAYPYVYVREIVRERVASLHEQAAPEPRHVEIPVCYGGEYGTDLAHVAELNGLTPQDVVDIHSSGEYVVYMLGFAPGFPYLGGMDTRIAAARKATPRLNIPAGSVGIAGEQTGIYPIATPGGWNLIGRTPLSLFLPDHRPPALLKAGDIVRFRPITPNEYRRMEAAP